MNIKTTLKTSVAAAALFAVAAPVVSTSADAGTWNSGNKNKVVMSGQVHRGLMYADDGAADSLFNVGGGSTSTRVRWIATGQMNESVSVKGLIEMNTPTSNDVNSSSLTITGGSQNRSTADRAWGIRHLDIKFSHKTMGALSIGQGNTASNGKSEVSYTGTGNVYYTGLGFGAGMDFVNSSTNISSGTSVGDIFTNFDGLSRADRIRYDLPSFNGLNIAVGYVDGGSADIGAGYSVKAGSVSFKMGAQYNTKAATSTTINDEWSVSGGVKHDSGLSLSGFYGQRDAVATNVDPEVWGATLGYEAKLNSMGKTAFSLNYASAEETNNTNGTEGDSWGVAVQQSIDSVGTALWAAYQNYSYDTIGSTSFDDVSVVYAGATVKF